ncbi:hypothetical protein [Pontibacter oryzae]|uniref:DUF1737 domain-containing protein n=1 Tax=Pontibacter oryzae TaxID=2304593 RepID=A0A399RVR1_9BACT|nr:hypothetical protein [Pontibacter oryzae]RIJ34413.1 hypothetical protein D1627_15975 [Pontibacter oryzae]
MDYDVINNRDLQVVASTVKTYMRHGWVPKGELLEQKGNYMQEMQRHPLNTNQQKQKALRQKSWIPWQKN